MVSMPFESPGSRQSEYGATPPPPGHPAFPNLFASPAFANNAVTRQQAPAPSMTLNFSGFREVHPSEFLRPPSFACPGIWFVVTRGPQVGIFSAANLTAHAPRAVAERFDHWDFAYTYYSFEYYDECVKITRAQPAVAHVPAQPTNIRPASPQPTVTQPVLAQPVAFPGPRTFAQAVSAWGAGPRAANPTTPVQSVSVAHAAPRADVQTATTQAVPVAAQAFVAQPAPVAAQAPVAQSASVATTAQLASTQSMTSAVPGHVPSGRRSTSPIIVKSTDPSPIPPPAKLRRVLIKRNVDPFDSPTGRLSSVGNLAPLGSSTIAPPVLASPFIEPASAGERIHQPVFKKKGKRMATNVSDSESRGARGSPQKNKARKNIPVPADVVTNPVPANKVIELSDSSDENDCVTPLLPNQQDEGNTPAAPSGKPRPEVHLCDSSDPECADCPPMISYPKAPRPCTCRCHTIIRAMETAAARAASAAFTAASTSHPNAFVNAPPDSADPFSATIASPPPHSPAGPAPDAFSSPLCSPVGSPSPISDVVAGGSADSVVNSVASPAATEALANADAGPSSSSAVSRKPRLYARVYTDPTNKSSAATRVVRHFVASSDIDYFAGFMNLEDPKVLAQISIGMDDPLIMGNPQAHGDGKD